MVTEGRRSFTGILHDLSDRVSLEHRLAEQKSLAKLGEMAAVVAHEVKNPIAGIRGALQVITSRMPAEQRDRGVLIDIIARLDALNRIVQDMLMFARPRSLRQEPVALAALLARHCGAHRTRSNDVARGDRPWRCRGYFRRS